MTVLPAGFMEMSAQVSSAGDPDPWTVTMGADTDPLVWDSTTPDSQALAAMAAWQDFYLNDIDSSMTFDGVNFLWRDANGDLFSHFEASGDPGLSIDGPFAPQNVCYLAHKITAPAGVRFRGRLYVPVVPESAVNSVGDLTAGAVSDFQARLDGLVLALEDTLQTGINRLVLLHSTSTLSATPPPTPITALNADGRVATQRRRMR